MLFLKLSQACLLQAGILAWFQNAYLKSIASKYVFRIKCFRRTASRPLGDERAKK